MLQRGNHLVRDFLNLLALTLGEPADEVGDQEEAANQIRRAAPRVKVETVTADLSTGPGVSALLAHIGDRPIEVLINNAGFGSYGLFAEADPDRESDEVAVDVNAVITLARAFLPGMLARRRPKDAASRMSRTCSVWAPVWHYLCSNRAASSVQLAASSDVMVRTANFFGEYVMNQCSRHQRIGRLTKWIAAILAVSAVIGIAQPARAENAVTRWAEQSLQAVRAANVGTPNAGRLYAMVTVAMYDAVNGIDAARHRMGREHALVPVDGAPPAGSRIAAAAAAAHAVLVALVPSRQAALDAALAAELAEAQDGEVLAGEIWGRWVGEQVVTLRTTDGTDMPLTIPAGAAVGAHRAAFDARFRNMTPFGVRSIDRYHSGPPPELTSAAYARAFNDVKTLGQQDGDAERNAIAQFWVVEGGTAREPGTWIQALVAIVGQMRTDRSLSDTARIFARVGMAIADGVAASWDTKATFLRGGLAIREQIWMRIRIPKRTPPGCRATPRSALHRSGHRACPRSRAPRPR